MTIPISITTAASAATGTASPRMLPPFLVVQHLIVLLLGNATLPGTRHSLPQFLIPFLIEEAKLNHATGMKAPKNRMGGLQDGGMDSLGGQRWDGWVGQGWLGLGNHSENDDAVESAAVSYKRKTKTQQAGGQAPLEKPAPAPQALLTLATSREPMNNSGRPVPHLLRAISSKFSSDIAIPPAIIENLAKANDLPTPLNVPIVFRHTFLAMHDSLEHEPMTYKSPTSKSGTAGHNGLRSVSASLTKVKEPPNFGLTEAKPPRAVPQTASTERLKFYQLPLGIGRPGAAGARTGDVSKWVLSRLDDNERLYWSGEGARGVIKELKALAKGLT